MCEPGVVRLLDPAGSKILEESVRPQVFDGDQEPQDSPARAVSEVPVLRLGAGVHSMEGVD
jgi:hypothetical protein